MSVLSSWGAAQSSFLIGIMLLNQSIFSFLLSKETKVGAFLLNFLCIAEHQEAFLTSSYRSVPAKVTIRVSTLRQESDIPPMLALKPLLE